MAVVLAAEAPQSRATPQCKPHTRHNEMEIRFARVPGWIRNKLELPKCSKMQLGRLLCSIYSSGPDNFQQLSSDSRPSVDIFTSCREALALDNYKMLC